MPEFTNAYPRSNTWHPHASNAPLQPRIGTSASCPVTGRHFIQSGVAPGDLMILTVAIVSGNSSNIATSPIYQDELNPPDTTLRFPPWQRLLWIDHGNGGPKVGMWWRRAVYDDQRAIVRWGLSFGSQELVSQTHCLVIRDGLFHTPLTFTTATWAGTRNRPVNPAIPTTDTRARQPAPDGQLGMSLVLEQSMENWRNVPIGLNVTHKDSTVYPRPPYSNRGWSGMGSGMLTETAPAEQRHYALTWWQDFSISDGSTIPAYDGIQLEHARPTVNAALTVAAPANYLLPVGKGPTATMHHSFDTADALEQFRVTGSARVGD